MDIPDYYVADKEFDEMPTIDRQEAYDTRAEGKKFLFGNGTQWGTHRNGAVGVLHKESERKQFAPNTTGRMIPRPTAGKPLTKNQRKKQRQKARRK